MSEVQSFFEPLPPPKADNLIQNCVLDHVKLALAAAESVTVMKVNLENRSSSNKTYIIMSSPKEELIGKICTFSCTMGTQLFFFKSKVAKDKIGFYLADTFTIYELKRRRHIRFNIPPEWNKKCSIFIDARKTMKVQADIVNLSLSGLRFALQSQLPEFRMHQKLSLSFQIHKRSEVQVQAEVVFVKKNAASGPILGVEFVDLSPLSEDKILNLCDDLSRYNLLKFKSA